MSKNAGHDREMGHRVIAGLRYAMPCEKPSCIPQSRPRGAKRLGAKYEKDFAKALQQHYGNAVVFGQWFHFNDCNGGGYCQTDLLVRLPGECLIFECKLTDTPRARSQLTKLYFPVVGCCWGLPTRGIVVTRHLTAESNLAVVVDQLAGALAGPPGEIRTLHWRERTPL